MTSSVDWCEANYAITPYIAEFWNTLSSLAMLFAGAFGAWVHRKVVEGKLLFAFGIVALVGVGSICFHATLKFKMQLLDELPMVYAVALMIYLLLENRPIRRFGAWLPLSLVAYCVVLTLTEVGAKGPVQVAFFLVGFTALEFSSLYLIYRLAQDGDAASKWLFRRGALAYGVAIVAWQLDKGACAFLSGLGAYGLFNPQLHAVWHVLVSVGWYLLVLVVANERARAFGKPLCLAHRGGIPRLVAESGRAT